MEREGNEGGQAGSARGEVLRRCREDYLTTVTFPQHKLELGQTLELQLQLQQQISRVPRRVSERVREEREGESCTALQTRVVFAFDIDWIV